MSLISTTYTSDYTNMAFPYSVNYFSVVGSACQDARSLEKTDQLLEGRRLGITLIHQDPNTAVNCSERV